MDEVKVIEALNQAGFGVLASAIYGSGSYPSENFRADLVVNYANNDFRNRLGTAMFLEVIKRLTGK